MSRHVLQSRHWSHVRTTGQCLRPVVERALSSLHDTPFEEEKLSSYATAQYFPIKIGDKLNNQYTVRVKLGYGKTSTTWLCTDQSNNYKVLKVTVANAGSKESSIYRYLKQFRVSTSNPGVDYLRHGEKIVQGEHAGRPHTAYIFQPLGPSIQDRMERTGSFTMSETRWVTKCLLEALSYLHEGGIIHTDVKLDNIQSTLPEPEHETLRKFVELERQDPGCTKISSTGSPVVASRQMLQDQLCTPILCDLGSAVFEYEFRPKLIQALPYRAPEVILGASWDSKVDIWNVGVLVHEMLSSRPLFGDVDEASCLRDMVRSLGSPPSSFLARCMNLSKFFGEDFHLHSGPVDRMRLEDSSDVSVPDRKYFDFLYSALSWDPEQRPSAAELLRHRWLQD